MAERGLVYLDKEAIEEIGAADADIRAIVQQKSAEVAQRARLFREERPAPKLAERTIILVDDGIATGGTVRAAIQALRLANPRRSFSRCRSQPRRQSAS